jgi:hypothetical protein
MEDLDKNKRTLLKYKIGFRYLQKKELYNKSNREYKQNKKSLMFNPNDGFIILVIGKNLKKNARLFLFSNKKILLGKKIGSIDKINIDKKPINKSKILQIKKKYFSFNKIEIEGEIQYNIKQLINEIKKENKFNPKDYNLPDNNCYNFIQFCLNTLKINKQLTWTKSYEYAVGIRPLNVVPKENIRRSLLNINGYHSCIFIGENINKNAILFEFDQNCGFRKINNVSLEKNQRKLFDNCANFNENFFDFECKYGNIHGYTLISPEILEYETKNSELWDKQNYNFINHNCQHYTDFCLEVLGSNHFLDYIFYKEEMLEERPKKEKTKKDTQEKDKKDINELNFINKKRK